MFLGYQKSNEISTPRKRGFRKTSPSLERPVHVVAERELKWKLRMEEEEEEEFDIGFPYESHFKLVE